MTAAARQLQDEPMPFPLPEKALGMNTIALAKTRAGKSSVLRLIAEHGLDQNIPTTILDPKGDWWGIKSSASGKSAGYPVVIFGGEHADVPINEHSGKAVAELIATGNRPALIDLGGWMPGDRTRFVIDFASTFFRLTRGRRWLFVDECHNFAPENRGGRAPDPQAGMMLHWFNRLASEGSGKGVTLFSASQRPQKVHKDYVSSHDTLIALRLVHPLDRAAAEDWIKGHDPAVAKQVLGTLAAMERGEGWVWSPEAKFGPKRIQFPLFSTFDSFAAPTGDEHVTKLKGWASVDLDEVKAKLAAVVEEAKKNDPAELKKENARLQRELAAAQKHPAAAPAAINVEEIRSTAFQAGFQDGFQTGHAQGFTDGADTMLSRLQDAAGAARAKLAPPPPKAITAAPKPTPRAAPRAAPAAPVDRSGLTPPQARILEALAFWRALNFDRPTRDQVGAAAGYSPSSGNFGNLLGQLRASGYVEYPAANAVSLTAEGAAIAPEGCDDVPVRERLAKILKTPQAKLLDALPQDGSPMSREALGDASGYSHTSGNFGNLLGQLRTLGLVTYPQTGFVALEPWVWS